MATIKLLKNHYIYLLTHQLQHNFRNIYIYTYIVHGTCFVVVIFYNVV